MNEMGTGAHNKSSDSIIKAFIKMAKKMKFMVIRRKLSTGLLVGGMKVVDCQEEWGVYAHDIPKNALGSTYYTNGTFKEIPSVELLVPQKIIDEIKESHCTYVEHMSAGWAKALVRQLEERVKLLEDKKDFDQDIYFKVAKLYSRSGRFILVQDPLFRDVCYKGKHSIAMRFMRIIEVC